VTGFSCLFRVRCAVTASLGFGLFRAKRELTQMAQAGSGQGRPRWRCPASKAGRDVSPIQCALYPDLQLAARSGSSRPTPDRMLVRANGECLGHHLASMEANSKNAKPARSKRRALITCAIKQKIPTRTLRGVLASCLSGTSVATSPDVVQRPAAGIDDPYSYGEPSRRWSPCCC